MSSPDPRLTEAVDAARERTLAQVASLNAAVESIVEASEQSNADDEHDPEGATIAYERAQAIALLRQARADLARLEVAQEELDVSGTLRCVVCATPIGVERVEALPTADRCIRCASA